MTQPYGMRDDGAARCVNVEPGTFGHECGQPASWIGTAASGSRACYCDDCREHGTEGRRSVAWDRIAPVGPSRDDIDHAREMGCDAAALGSPYPRDFAKWSREERAAYSEGWHETKEAISRA